MYIRPAVAAFAIVAFATSGAPVPTPSRPLIHGAAKSAAEMETRPISDRTVLDFGAHGTATIQLMGVIATTGSTSMRFVKTGNWSAPAFNDAMVGMPIEVGYAGTGRGTLSTKIAAVLSPTELMLTDPAASTVNNQPTVVLIGFDDTSAVQAAFDFSAKHEVRFPCGTYRITAPLITPPRSIVRGASNHPYTDYPGGAGPNNYTGCTRLVADPNMFPIHATAFVTLGALSHWEGMETSLQHGPAINNLYGTEPFVELVHNKVYGGTNGVNMQLGSGNQGWMLFSNDVAQVSGDCFQDDSGGDFSIVNNYFHACGSSAINLNAAGVGIVVGNFLEDSNNGIRLAGAAVNLTITGNRFNGNYFCDICFVSFSGNAAVVANVLGETIAPEHAVWLFSNAANPGAITVAGNTYKMHGETRTYTFWAPSGFSLGQGSAFYEEPFAMAAGLYNSLATQAIIQPLIVHAPGNLPGSYENDGAAASAGVTLGAEYYDSAGFRRRRIR